MTGRSGRANGLIIIAAAAFAGLAAGGIALYAGGGFERNAAQVAGAAPAAEADDTCPAKAALAKTVGDAATGEVAAMLPADPPRSMAALAFNGPDGKATTLAAFQGRTVLMNIWATWCAPCRAEMPALDALEREAGGESFEVVAVNVDTGGDEKPKAFLQEIGVTALGYYRDASMGVFNDLKRQGLALGLPATLLIDADGCLLAHMNGPAEWSSPDARRLIEAALPSG